MKNTRFTLIFLAFFALLSSATLAGPQDLRRTPVVEAFQKNKDAVVSISSKYVQEVNDDIFGWGLDWPFQRRRVVIPSLGSGFIIHPSGYIVTNAHVVRRANEITVIMSDNSEYPARIIAQDSTADIALIKISRDDPFPTVSLGHSDDLMIGETVLAIGNPFGYQQSLTDGILSAIHRDVELDQNQSLPQMLQISAPINPGNSGGPLININGDVIGINTAIRRAAQGIGFAIPIDQLFLKLPDMINIETIRRVELGIEVENNVTEGTMNGVRVTSVIPGSEANKANIKTGDIIKKVDDSPVNSTIDFYLDMLQYPIGTSVTFDIASMDGTNKTTKTTKLTLREKPKPDGSFLAEAMFGLDISSLTTGMINRYNWPGEPGNVFIKNVKRNSPAYNAGIEKGDIIVAINNIKVENVDQLGLILENIKAEESVNVLYIRARKRWNQIIIEQYAGTVRALVDGSTMQTQRNDSLHIDL